MKNKKIINGGVNAIIDADKFIGFHLEKLKIIMQKQGYLIDTIFITLFSEELEKYLNLIKKQINQNKILDFDDEFNINNIFYVMNNNIINLNINYLNKLNFRSLLLLSLKDEYYINFKNIIDYNYSLLTYDNKKIRNIEEILLNEEDEILNFIIVIALNLSLFSKFINSSVDELKTLLFNKIKSSSITNKQLYDIDKKEIKKSPKLNFEPFTRNKELSPNTLTKYLKKSPKLKIEPFTYNKKLSPNTFTQYYKKSPHFSSKSPKKLNKNEDKISSLSKTPKMSSTLFNELLSKTPIMSPKILKKY